MSHLTPEEKLHSRNPELIEALLSNDITNENYNIKFEKLSPNVVLGTFTNKETDEVYQSNFGLPVDDNGSVVKAEPHFQTEPMANPEPLVFWGFKNGESIPYNPDFEIKSVEFIDFISGALIAVHDNRGIDNLNNARTPDIKNIDDLPIE